MIHKLFLILMVSCSLCSACSEEGATFHPVSEEITLEQGKALLTISLTLPLATETRSQTHQEGGTEMAPEASLDKECKVTDAWVVLGELANGQQAPIHISQIYYIDKFQYAGNPAQWSATIPCMPGNYRIAIIVNPGKLFTQQHLPANKNWDALARHIVRCQTFGELKQIWQDNYFLMTNAFRGRADEHDVVLVTGQHTYKDLYVQRVCARFDYQVKNEDNRYDLICKVNGTEETLSVALTHVALMNVSNNFNLFKMVVPDNQLGRVPNFYQYETPDNYVYDSDWTEKRIFHATPIFEDWKLKDLFFFPSERKSDDPTPPESLRYIALPGALNPKDVTLTYASENTLPGVLAQINKLSTGLVFKGSFQLPAKYAGVKEVYYRSLRNGHELYTSLEALKQSLQEYILPLQPTDEQLAQLDVMRFTKQKEGTFPVYYTYWNRHNDNQKPLEMGIMEFAVVRNNVYKLRVNTISSLGLPLSPADPQNPWKPDGNTPDEQLPQIDVAVEVCDWVTRELVHEI